ncbi:MAG: hypothetical protein AB8B74_08620 [Crocinitomicaceae bacterium]
MDEIKKWKDMYQKQEVNTKNVDTLVERLNRIEVNVKRRRRLLIIVSGILIISAIIRLSEFENKFFIIAFVLIGIAIAMKLSLLYRGKYDVVNNESEFNNQSFIKDHISKLKEKITFEKKHLLIFLIVLIVGLNCILIGMYDKGTIFNFEFNENNRIYIHLSTLVIFLAGYYVNSKKIDRYKKNILELIRDLESQDKE